MMQNAVILLALFVGVGCTTDFARQPDDAFADNLVDISIVDSTGDSAADSIDDDDDDDSPVDSSVCAPICTDLEMCVAGYCVGRGVAISYGSFLMGSPINEAGRTDEEVQHTVTLQNNFEVQLTEVTQAQFVALMGYNPSAVIEACETCPVESVSWPEAAAYANELSRLRSLPACYTCSGSAAGMQCTLASDYSMLYTCEGYRLPTEAEWEYMARGGATAATYAGDLNTERLHCEPNPILADIAWFCGNSTQPQPVGQKSPNTWGLYDVLGNVFEWTHDCKVPYEGDQIDPWDATCEDHFVTRGGGWGWDAAYARAASRTQTPIGAGGPVVGFRLVRTL
jgi:formylglycine-generating enzyme required for sulfatase activity